MAFIFVMLCFLSCGGSESYDEGADDSDKTNKKPLMSKEEGGYYVPTKIEVVEGDDRRIQEFYYSDDGLLLLSKNHQGPLNATAVDYDDTSFITDDDGRLLEKITPRGTESYTYDDNGFLTSFKNENYKYECLWNRKCSFSK